jgi:hypothetical protein
MMIQNFFLNVRKEFPSTNNIDCILSTYVSNLRQVFSLAKPYYMLPILGVNKKMT